jgi:uncharacterized protein YkwD
MTARHHKRKSKKPKLGVCHYHLCKKRTEVYKCKYCGEFFCKEHLRAKPPGLPRFKSTSHQDLLFMEEWRKPGGHPCVPFLKHWMAENKRKKQKYNEALDRLINSEPLGSSYEESDRRKVSVYEKMRNYWSWHKRKIIKVIVILIILGVIGYLVYNGFQSGQIQSFSTNITNEINEWWNKSGESVNPVNIISSKPNIDINELELQIHNLVNEERRKKGLNPLDWDSKLADIARKHSQDMAENNFFSHNNLKGQDATERGKLAGYSCRKDFGSYYKEGIAENIFQNTLYDSITYYNGIPSYDWYTQEEIARSTVRGWMTSSGHRKNILTATYDKEGIGVAMSSNNQVMITQDFC